MADDMQDTEPARKRLKRGSYIHRTVGKLTIAAADTSGTVDSASFENKVSESQVYWHFENDGQSVSLPNSKGHYGAIFFGSKQPFTIKKIAIENSPSWHLNPVAGKTVFVIEPLPDPDNIFPLLSLPPELRFMIFKLVLVKEAMLYVWEEEGSTIHKLNQSLFLVNRQIRAESFPIFITYNEFAFQSTRSGLTFIRRLGAEARFLRRIAVHWTWYINTGAEFMKLIADLPIREICLILPEKLKLKKIARSAAKGWFALHAPSEDEVDSLMSLIKFGKCNACAMPGGGGFGCFGQPFQSLYEEDEQHGKRMKEELAGLIDDLVL